MMRRVHGSTEEMRFYILKLQGIKRVKLQRLS